MPLRAGRCAALEAAAQAAPALPDLALVLDLDDGASAPPEEPVAFASAPAPRLVLPSAREGTRLGLESRGATRGSLDQQLENDPN